MKKIKVLVVDDSAFMRKVISDFLSSDSRIEVIGTARNGEDALKKIKKITPDVLTMDIEMPIMNGIEALQIIMDENPLPVIMLSSTTKEGADNTIVAMEIGAVDFIPKPSGAISLDLYKVKDELIEKVVQACGANLKEFSAIRDGMHQDISFHKRNSAQELNTLSDINSLHNKKKIICIGTSTGGPRALQQVLTGIPKEVQAPILIVQHMPPGFTKSLATRMDSLCKIHVKEASHGEVLQNGTAYIAPGGYHMKVKKIGTTLAINIDQSTITNGHRPSVDILFESVSSVSGYEKIAVIMTGMGSDGSNGLIKMKASGDVKVIAESESTCIVYGMPKAAVATNSVDAIVNLENISATIMKYVEA